MIKQQRKWLLALLRAIRDLQAAPLERRMLALDIQKQLLHRVARAERLIRQLRKENKRVKQLLAQRGNSKEVARQIKAKNVNATERVANQQYLISILRTIGDSIVFIYGDRWDLKQMFQKEDSGFLTGKRGARLERRILRHAFEIGATVVLNDLTHTLRHGDISVFRPDLWPEGGSPFLIIEVKSGRGGDAARTARQMAATQKVLTYLSTDSKEVESGLWRRVSVTQEPQSHSETASRMMSDLPLGGWLVEEVEPGLHYVVIGSATPDLPFDAISGDVVRGRKPFILSVNEMKKHALAYCPFPLSITSPETLVRFYNGEFVMWVIVDLDVVNQMLLPHLIKVVPVNNDEFPWQVVPINGEGVESYVGYHPIGRLAAEFLRLDWLVLNMVAGPAQELIHEYASSVTPVAGDEN